jgi:hypothetical protein
VHATEDDDISRCCGSLAGEPQRVADIVGDILNFGTLIVVGEHHGVAGPGKPANLSLQ